MGPAADPGGRVGRPVAADPGLAEEPNPLLALLRRCVVPIRGDGAFLGTGFLVAPGEVLTVAHVIHGEGEITVEVSGVSCSATVARKLPNLEADDPAARFYPLPDVALLRLDDPPDHPCVRLIAELPVAAPHPDVLYVDGYTVGQHAAKALDHTAAATEYEGPLEEEGRTLLKLRRGQVVGGLSGAPLLDLRTGGVCGLVESSRDERSDLGGFGVPLAAFAADLPGLLERNAAYDSSHETWQRAVEDEQTRAQQRAGDWERLPVLPPRLDLEWTPEVSPSDLLRPRYGVVPFVGRKQLLDQLMLWRERDDRLAVVVLAGGGGFGKTRTAIEACLDAERAGWSTGLLGGPDLAEQGAAVLEELASWRGRLFVAIDYAETRPDLVTGLLVRLRRRRDRPAARVVLVVRQATDRRQLEDAFGSVEASEEMASLLQRADFVRLDAAEQELDREELFERAVAAFADRLGRDAPMGSTPSLHAVHFERPLFVLAGALLVAGEPETDVAAMSADELLIQVLNRHEANYWQRLNEELDLDLHPDDQRRLVAMGALMGADTEQEAVTLVRLVPGFEQSDGERVRAIARWLSRLYGSGRLDRPPVIASLQPDLLTEVLVADVFPHLPEAAGKALDAASDSQLVRVLLVLSRAAVGREPLLEVARSALDDRLPTLVQRAVSMPDRDEVVAALRLALRSIGPRRGAIEAVEGLPERSLALSLLAAEVTELAADTLRTLAEASPEPFLPLLAVSLNHLANRLTDLGRPVEALATVEEAVKHYRDLAKANPDRFLPDLAGSLNNLSNSLGDVGRPVEALAAIEEAVKHHRALAQADPDRFLPDLTASLNNLSGRLADMGRSGEALALIEEAVQRRRALARADPARFLPELAMSLNNLSNRLGDEGRFTEALAACEEAVRLRRVLARANPDSFLPELASSLNNLSNRLGELGRSAEALAAIEEAVRHRRVLALANPDRFLPDLASSLNNLSVRLGDIGKYAEALAAIEEAVEQYRILAGANPHRFLPELTISLNNLTGRLGELGRSVEALAAIEEAVKHYRALIAVNPDRFMPELAMALNNLSNSLSEVGRYEEALAPSEEGVEHYRALARANPNRFVPELAMALNNLSNRLSNLDRSVEALAAIEEAVGNYRALARVNADRFLPELAMSLNNLSASLREQGRSVEALAAIEEAVGHYRALNEANPGRFQPDLAMSLNNLSNHLADQGKVAQALTPIEEAVEHRRVLARADPGRSLPDLASSLSNLCMRLAQLGRDAEVVDRFGEALAEHRTNPWATGVLLFALADRRWAIGDLAGAIKDAWTSTQLLDGANDLLRRGEARTLLRSMRADDTPAFDEAWAEAIGPDEPLWLRWNDDSQATVQRIIEWVRTETWEQSQAYLTNSQGALLTDEAEAALEHLIDANPGNSALLRHLEILQAARGMGVAAAYEALFHLLHLQALAATLAAWIETTTWEASRVFLAEHEELLSDEAEAVLARFLQEDGELIFSLHLGLLVLCRLDGIEAVYELMSDQARLRAPIGVPMTTDEEKRRSLALARLRAGSISDSADVQLDHAVAALAAGDQEEAEGAAARCAELLASWERPSRIRRLATLAASRPELTAGLARLQEILSGATSEPADQP